MECLRDMNISAKIFRSSKRQWDWSTAPHIHTCTSLALKIAEGFFIKGFCLTLCLPFKSLLTVVYLRLCTTTTTCGNLKIKTSSISSLKYVSQPFCFFLNYYWSKFIRILCKSEGRAVVKRKSETLDLFLIFSLLSVCSWYNSCCILVFAEKNQYRIFPSIAK